MEIPFEKPFFCIKLNYFTYSILDEKGRHYQMVAKEEKEDKFDFQDRAQAICDELNKELTSARQFIILFP